jgi:hypothetical protein
VLGVLAVFVEITCVSFTIYVHLPVSLGIFLPISYERSGGLEKCDAIVVEQVLERPDIIFSQRLSRTVSDVIIGLADLDS